jgi:methylated-DNA-protein-cysteine methyltransferase-like protein
MSDERSCADAAILAVVAAIPRGCISTYGLVAERAGLPRRARLVGRVLSRLPRDTRVPWHRVTAAGGRIVFPLGSSSHRRQRARLLDEGVVVLNGRVDIEHYGWSTPHADLDRWLWAPEPRTTREAGTSRKARAASGKAASSKSTATASGKVAAKPHTQRRRRRMIAK